MICLAILATRLSHYLVTLGVGPEIPVGIMFEKSAWAVVSELAILKASGIVIPFNPQHPSNAIRPSSKQSISPSSFPLQSWYSHLAVI